jgi:AcrR family transcriptional regulator
MTNQTQPTQSRASALSKTRIVETAIEMLDAGGEGALTFRALATRLATGSGAIYWHVADKRELLAATADHVIGRVVTDLTNAEPREAIRAISLGVFDAIHAHPWVGAQLAREPWQSAMVQVFERVGGQLQALGVPESAQFNAASALLNFILGSAGQNAAAARIDPRITDRSAFLANIVGQWTERDPLAYPFVHRVAAQLREHDDRAQFLAGIDLILAGIATVK